MNESDWVRQKLTFTRSPLKTNPAVFLTLGVMQQLGFPSGSQDMTWANQPQFPYLKHVCFFSLGLTTCVPCTRLVGLPLSRWLGVRDHARRPVRPNTTLEKHFLMEGQRPKEVRSPLPFSIPVRCMAAVWMEPTCWGQGKPRAASLHQDPHR